MSDSTNKDLQTAIGDAMAAELALHQNRALAEYGFPHAPLRELEQKLREANERMAAMVLNSCETTVRIGSSTDDK